MVGGLGNEGGVTRCVRMCVATAKRGSRRRACRRRLFPPKKQTHSLLATTNNDKQQSTTRSLASRALSTGEGWYRTARGLVPSAAEPLVAQAEDSAAAFAAPLVASANDRAAELLGFADARVDALLGAVGGALDYSRGLHARNMGSFADAKAQAFGLVEAYVDAARAALDPQRYVDYAAATGRALVASVAAAADPDRAADYVAGLAASAKAVGPVSKALELADPLLAVGTSQYARAHDVLVAQPLYRALYEVAAGAPAKVAASPLYKAAYPLVAPVADPVIGNFQRSKVLRRLDDHLKPKSA